MDRSRLSAGVLVVACAASVGTRGPNLPSHSATYSAPVPLTLDPGESTVLRHRLWINADALQCVGESGVDDCGALFELAWFQWLIETDAATDSGQTATDLWFDLQDANGDERTEGPPQDVVEVWTGTLPTGVSQQGSPPIGWPLAACEWTFEAPEERGRSPQRWCHFDLTTTVTAVSDLPEIALVGRWVVPFTTDDDGRRCTDLRIEAW